ncbi:hypothetical protein CLPUN_38000 [Clostridium puniceum]|uniref:DUF6906 domain-containing protein n=1 Tax=Clostridium puniceum TaxID=29367 RepID=A0A1S8TAA5_9CLOT|nr:hypothetical protein [Clostridium puniceum]OOM74559.1 hypothetical protein CLPUN_38000 [Clostridium puniceum]
MKNAKKLTREQKRFLSSKGYEVACYLVVKNTTDTLFILNKITGIVGEVPK